MSAVPLLEARRLSKWFGEVIAVNDVTLSLGAGVTGLLGLNGAGKTTLFKLMAGLIEPSGGEILLEGGKLRREVALFGEIGFCPESDALFDWLTGREFLELMNRLLGMDGDRCRRRGDEVLELVRLTGAADRRIGGYSKGMRQKLKLAQALAHRPRIIFLDEPLNGTDPVTRHEIIELVQELGSQGCCVVVSSHVLPEVEAMTDNVILIHHGQLAASGDVAEIREAIHDHPTVVAITTGVPRRWAALLAGCEEVAGVELDARGRVVARTEHAAAFYRGLPRWSVEHDLPLQAVETLDDSLQAVFDYLVGEGS